MTLYPIWSIAAVSRLYTSMIEFYQRRRRYPTIGRTILSILKVKASIAASVRAVKTIVTYEGRGAEQSGLAATKSTTMEAAIAADPSTVFFRLKHFIFSSLHSANKQRSHANEPWPFGRTILRAVNRSHAVANANSSDSSEMV